MVKWIFGRGHGRCGGSVCSGGCERSGAAAAAVAVGGRQSHRAGWLEKKLDVLGVSAVFGLFKAISTFWSVF